MSKIDPRSVLYGAPRPRGVSPRTAIVIVLVFALLIVGVFVLVIGDFGTGYKFEITGTVDYNMASNSWTIKSLDNTEPERDYKLFTTLWSLPWESGDVIVRASVDGNTYEYKFDSKFRTTGDAKDFSIPLRHISEGSKTISIDVFELDCGLLPINCGENNVASTGIVVELWGE